MRLLGVLLALLAVVPALAQRPPYADQVLLKNGDRLLGQIVEQTDERIDLRMLPQNLLRSFTIGEIREIRLKEQVYLELARSARSTGQFKNSLLLFEKVRNNHRQHSTKNWKQIAEKEIRTTLSAIAASRYQDIIFLRKGTYLIGNIISANEQTIRIRLKLGTADYRRESIKKILYKEQMTLSQGDLARKAGRMDDAIQFYLKV